MISLVGENCTDGENIADNVRYKGTVLVLDNDKWTKL
jgi:hypothetical protein